MSYHQPVRTSGRLLGGSFYKVCIAALSLVALAVGLRAQDAAAAPAPGKGTIEGRVLNMGNGKYLSSALVTVAGANITALTNDYGEYTLRNVPAGSVTVTASYTGQEPKSATVNVEADKTVSQDFGLSRGKDVMDDGTIVLDQYVVAQERFKNAQEIAINEERRSVVIKDVVATDALGYIHAGNVGEFVKYLPGIQTEYGGMDAFGGAGIGGINQATASQVSVRGFSSAETAITIDGVPVAGVGPGQLTRAVGLDMMSINNASRIELVKVAGPDSPGDAAGGTINLVTKSAFEYAKPSYTGMLGFSYVTGDGSPFKKQPGPADEPTYHALPSASLSVAVPLNKKLGFTVSLASANNYSPNYYVQSKWQTAASYLVTGTQWTTSSPTGTVTVRPPVNSPYDSAWVTTNSTATTRYYNVGNLANGRLVDLSNPFLRQAIDDQNPWTEKRLSAGLKVDWKPVNSLQISAGYTGSMYDGVNVDRRFTASVYQPMEWTDSYVYGRPYEAAGTFTQATPYWGGTYPAGMRYAALNPGNRIEQEVTSRDKSGVTHTGFIRFNWSRGPWAATASAGGSRTDMDLDDFKNGHVYRVFLDGAGITGRVNLLDIEGGAPSKIEVWDRSGNPIDFKNINNWTFSDIKVGSAKSAQQDTTGDFRFDVRRELDFLPFNAWLKVGASRKLKQQEKSGLGTGYSMKYTGVVDAAFIDSITDPNFKRTGGLGFAKNMNWVDTYRMYQVYEAHPEMFSLTPLNTDGTPDMSYPVGNYRSIINQSKSVKETTDGAFIMVDGTVFNERLSYVVGVKQSRSKIQGIQPYQDNKWNYLRNPNGTLYTDDIYRAGVRIDWFTSQTAFSPSAPGATQVGGRYVGNGFLDDAALLQRLAAAGVAYPDHLFLGTGGQTSAVATAHTQRGTVEAAQRNLFLKSVHNSRTNPVQPSVILAYKITDNITFKPSWSREISLPPLDAGNGNTAGLLGTYTITENDPSTAEYNTEGGAGSIKFSNADLKPKEVNSLNGQLSWYNKYGNVSFSYYYKFINNEWINNVITYSSPSFAPMMQDLGFDPEALRNWKLETTENSNEKSHASGYELSFRQNFAYFGSFMEHFNAFGNYSKKNVRQVNKTNIVSMTTLPDTTWAGGLNFSANKFSLSAKVTFVDENWSKAGTVQYGLNDDGTNRVIQLYNVDPRMYNLDLDLNYQITQHFSFFAAGKNVLNAQRKKYLKDAAGIMPEYAQITGNYEFGVQVTSGIQFTF